MKKWECTVCGYIHEGETPPDECPLCGASSDKFVLLVDNEEPEVKEEAPVVPTEVVVERPGFFARLKDTLHLHPISVHTPSGLLPVAVVFLAIALLLGLDSFAKAAYYNLVFVFVVMPAVLGSGYVDWKARYQKAKTPLFITKITCGLIVLVSVVILAVWPIFEPGVAGGDSPFRHLYFMIALLATAATLLAGHLGGKLVFAGRK